MINWDKPKKIRSTEGHNKTYQSDSGVPGTFVPNMSTEDMYSWKGKLVGTATNSPRVELRKSFSRNGHYAQMLVVIYISEDYVTISSNGKIAMTLNELSEFHQATDEAIKKLKETINDRNRNKN